MPVTIQTGANSFNRQDIVKYSLMMGGLNTVHDVLKQYDPLIGGYYRIFMVRKPTALVKYFQTNTGVDKFTAFKHILEYGNLGYSGIQSPSVEFAQIQGGYNNKSFEIPQMASDGTNSVSITVFELSGSPIREVLYTWINMVADLESGFAHYGGMIASGELGYNQANHTAEFIICCTDRTGMKLEYAVHLTNCFPGAIPTDHFNGQAGTHDIAQFDIEFHCNAKYGVDVNRKALILLKNHQIMVNSLETCTRLSETDLALNPTGYNPKTGTLETRSGNKLSQGTADEVQYTAKINEANVKQNPFDTSAAAVRNNEDLQSVWRPTPSFTDFGNQHVGD